MKTAVTCLFQFIAVMRWNWIVEHSKLSFLVVFVQLSVVGVFFKHSCIFSSCKFPVTFPWPRDIFKRVQSKEFRRNWQVFLFIYFWLFSMDPMSVSFSLSVFLEAWLPAPWQLTWRSCCSSPHHRAVRPSHHSFFSSWVPLWLSSSSQLCLFLFVSVFSCLKFAAFSCSSCLLAVLPARRPRPTKEPASQPSSSTIYPSSGTETFSFLEDAVSKRLSDCFKHFPQALHTSHSRTTLSAPEVQVYDIHVAPWDKIGPKKKLVFIHWLVRPCDQKIKKYIIT